MALRHYSFSVPQSLFCPFLIICLPFPSFIPHSHHLFYHAPSIILVPVLIWIPTYRDSIRYHGLHGASTGINTPPRFPHKGAADLAQGAQFHQSRRFRLKYGFHSSAYNPSSVLLQLLFPSAHRPERPSTSPRRTALICHFKTSRRLAATIRKFSTAINIWTAARW